MSIFTAPPPVPRSRGLYRARDGMFFGVCKGIAEYSELPVSLVRILLVAICLMGSMIPAVLYFVAAIVMKPKPMVPFRGDNDQEFYNSYVSSRSMALGRLKRTFDSLDRRIQRLEDIVTTREYSWDRRMNERDA